MNILADDRLPALDELFPKPFTVITYKNDSELTSALPDSDILLCRSTLKVSAELLANCKLQCVGTASSGTDHIDTKYLKSVNITFYDAKGSNASAVADYVTATIAWLEIHKKITGKKAGVIGVGEVGKRVIKRLQAAGYDVVCYDPYQHYVNKEILMDCDVLCIHPNLHQTGPYPSFNLINADFIKQLKPQVSLINAARGGVVNETDLLQAPIPIQYCTDVYLNEPTINPKIVNFATLCTPHIAGHSIESKHRAMVQLSIQLHKHFNLSPPIELTSTNDSTHYFNTLNPWQEIVLSHYNPEEETIKLQQDHDKTGIFLKLRHQHIHRHDFAFYD